MTQLRTAVFLDRDGTIIQDAEYLARPEGVVLIPGAGRAIRRLNDARMPVIIVTNQSGIARGRVSQDEYEAVERRTAGVLAEAAGARVDATYMCPHHPDFTGACDCRKPGTLLFRSAAEEHHLDLARSFFIGDRWRDIAPALAFGGRGILVASPVTPAGDRERANRELESAASLAEAVDRVLAAEASAA